MPRVTRSFDASNRECALIAIQEPEKYQCLQEWAGLVFLRLNSNDRSAVQIGSQTAPPKDDPPFFLKP